MPGPARPGDVGTSQCGTRRSRASLALPVAGEGAVLGRSERHPSAEVLPACSHMAPSHDASDARVRQLSPATRAIVRDDLPQHSREGGRVDPLALANRDGTCGLVTVSARYDAFWVGHDRTVVQ